MGHKVGDLLLTEVAKRLQACVRGEDLAARLGGDEFVVLLQDAPPQEVEHIVNRIARALSRPYELAAQRVTTGASIGVVSDLTRYSTPNEVLEHADIAMYRAKELGCTTLHYSDALYKEVSARQRTESELQSALGSDALRLVYQPVLSLESGETVFVEALLRWQHPTRGLLAPEAFLEVAEETGLIVPLGLWALRTACAELAAADVAFGVSVNLSRRQLLRPELLEETERVLRDTGLSPKRLRFEVTESAVVSHHTAAEQLRTLRALGVQLMLDDFGTGYSSLSALHHLPWQALKIDRAFVQGITCDPRSLEIVRTMLALARSLGLEVVAEGVETAAQAQSLRALGCRYAQGYLFAKPRPLAELTLAQQVV